MASARGSDDEGSTPAEHVRHLEGTDVQICHLQSQPELNGIGARCVRYYPQKGRYAVRIHYTGRTLLLKPSCIVPAPPLPISPGKKVYMQKDDEVFEALAAYIRKNPDVRRQLSQRCKEGFLSKGPGAMIANIYDVHSAVPRALSNAAEVLLSPQQTVWMSNQELKQTYGRAWTHGCGEIYGLEAEWPALVEQTALFARVLNFEPWNDALAEPGEDVVPAKKYYDRWGLRKRTMVKTFRDHVARRVSGELTLPATPPNEYDRALLAMYFARDSYDSNCQVCAEPFTKMYANTPMAAAIHPLEPCRALWKDHDKMNGYKDCSSFCLLSFKAVPVATEKAEGDVLPNLISNTGWMVLGFERVGFWLPYVEDELSQAESDLEKLRLFQLDKSDVPSEAAINYKGGSFTRTLPSSAKLTTYDCGNPHCDKSELKLKKTGKLSTRQGPNLYRCSRCQKEKYCSKACQTADWKRHKKLCNKKEKSEKI